MRKDTVHNESRDLELGAVVTMFEINYSRLLDAGDPLLDILYLCNLAPGYGKTVSFRGQTYLPMPISLAGVEVSTQGTHSRPSLEITDFDGSIGDLSEQVFDFVGAVVTIRRTYEQFLDGGDSADGWEEFIPLRLWVSRRTQANPGQIIFELSNPLDAQETVLPARTVETNNCPFVYKSGRGCNWTEAKALAREALVPPQVAHFDVHDQPLPPGDPDEKCGKFQSSCRLRFGDGETQPFGGFPGALRPY